MIGSFMHQLVITQVTQVLLASLRGEIPTRLIDWDLAKAWLARHYADEMVREAQARLDRELAELTLRAQLKRFVGGCLDAIAADWEADQARLWRQGQARLRAAYERRRDAHRQAFARTMAAQGYAEVEGGAFGLPPKETTVIAPKGELGVAECPE